MLKNISDKFITEANLSKIIRVNKNSIKCKQYEADLHNNNHMNNLHHTFQTAGIDNIDVLNH